MELRAYQPADLEEIYQLFYDTVHSVNRKDYGLEQLDAWAPRQMDRPRWEQSLADHETWVAWEDGKIVGFGDLGEGGYLDRLYVHKDFVRKGILPLCWPGWRNPLRARAAAAFIRRRLSLPGRFSSAGVTR